MKKVFILVLFLFMVGLNGLAIADKADDLRVLMTDARGALDAMQVEESIEFCDKAIELDPNFAEGYANRAIAKATKEDFDGALVDAKKAIELDPDSPKIHFAYYVRAAIALDQAAEPDKALEYINKAIALKDDDPFSYELRASIYEKLGNTELAEKDYAKSESVAQP